MTEILIASHGHFASGLKSSIDILTGMGNQIKTIDAYADLNQKVVLKVATEKDIYVITQTNLVIVMAVLLDSEKKDLEEQKSAFLNKENEQ